MAGRRPDYSVNAMDKRTGEKARIGAAWINPDCSIRIVLNPFVVLTANPDLVITMFTNKTTGPDDGS